ncbi:MAG: hypothetical protein ACFFD4_26420 [Candidatus Odinarchaeota archaeon]
MFSTIGKKNGYSNNNSSIGDHTTGNCTFKSQMNHFRVNNSYKTGSLDCVLAETKTGNLGFDGKSPSFSAVLIIDPSREIVTSKSAIKKTVVANKNNQMNNNH